MQEDLATIPKGQRTIAITIVLNREITDMTQKVAILPMKTHGVMRMVKKEETQAVRDSNRGPILTDTKIWASIWIPKTNLKQEALPTEVMKTIAGTK